ncbi:protein ALP1-like [Pyrus communis]|uniref:protein ALP1-like n=1 Tax=Pyrus communis TaxID=23211 RepID=UPI0035BF1682
MIGSLYCIHWDWKNCLTRWQGGFSGRSRKPIVVLKTVALYDTWIWHVFFGVPGSQNDITVLGRSPIFNRLTEGKTPQLDYYINNRQYNMGYYLADNIYTKWATLVQAIPNPRNDAEKLFTLHQEAYQKDVERVFGILQARWNIISEPARGWSRENLDSIMMSCIILHNMIVEDEQDEYIDEESDDDQEDPNRSRRVRAKIYDGPNLPFNLRTSSICINEYMRRYKMICSCATNKYLQQDLVAHLWAKRSME